MFTIHISVVFPGPGSCCADPTQREAIIVQDSGYIAKSITDQHGCGSIDCPWLVKVAPGQRLNISMFDFGRTVMQSRGDIFSHDSQSSICSVYAIIKEESIGSTMTVCAKDQRFSKVYTSTTNSVEIRIVTKSKQDVEDKQFVIYFEGI